MPKYEVHIPAETSRTLDKTFEIEAENWMAALRLGMGQLGEQGSAVQNILADIQSDGSVHVTESRSGRVFRVRPITAEESKFARPKAILLDKPLNLSAPLRSSLPALPFSSPLPPPSMHPRAPSVPVASSSASPLPLAQPKPQKTISQIIELEKPIKPVTSGSIGRVELPPTQSGEIEVFADIFERVIEASGKSREEALYFFLDLAMEKMGVEAGSVLVTDGLSGKLRFAAVRGPRAEEILKSAPVVPSGEGIVGFCLREGVSLALSDIQKDPRFYPGVTESISFKAASVLCAPIAHDGRMFGCIELLNRRPSPLFQKHEIGVLSYIADRIALYLGAL